MVKAIRKISIIVFFFTGIICAGNDEELFLRANKFYQMHDYNQALSLYEMISHKGSAVLYNMGNCYFHINNYSHALIYWLRAEKGATLDEYKAISYNKNHLIQKMGKNKEEDFLYKVKQLLEMSGLYISVLALQLLIIVLWGLLLFLYHRNSLQRIKAFLLIISLCFFVGILYMQQLQKGKTFGIIVQKHVPLFLGPDSGFDSVGFVDYADHVTITQIRKDWYKIRYFDNIGWIKAEAIQII